MISPIWIEEAVVIAIHRRQLAEHGGSDGIRDKGLLESALSRPRNAVEGKHLNLIQVNLRPKNQLAYGNPTIFDLAAAYGYGIAKNHPFIDGNKRTSYVVMRTFLKLNGYDIQASAIEKYQIWMGLANNQINEAELANWIEEKSVKY